MGKKKLKRGFCVVTHPIDQCWSSLAQCAQWEWWLSPNNSHPHLLRFPINPLNSLFPKPAAVTPVWGWGRASPPSDPAIALRRPHPKSLDILKPADAGNVGESAWNGATEGRFWVSQEAHPSHPCLPRAPSDWSSQAERTTSTKCFYCLKLSTQPGLAFVSLAQEGIWARGKGRVWMYPEVFPPGNCIVQVSFQSPWCPFQTLVGEYFPGEELSFPEITLWI